MYYNPMIREHRNSVAEIDDPARVDGTMDYLRKNGTLDKVDIKTGHVASLQELLYVHSPKYIKFLRTQSPEMIAISFADVSVNKFSLLAATTSVGLALDAATDVLTGDCKHGFVMCRPPGHHASYNKASGFCLFNNIVYAAKLLSTHKKVLIFDWDVHHGDGTETLVEGMKNVHLVTIQRYDKGEFYPGTGSTHSSRNITSVGFNGSIDGESYIKLFNEYVMKVVNTFKPSVILISAGFDAAVDDPLGGCRLAPSDYHEMTKILIDNCDNVLAFLEGGYCVASLSKCVDSVISAMLNNTNKS
jgi:acetoin utilization deacetylase AcuC-like enzyme